MALPPILSRVETRSATLLTLVLWAAALLLWSAPDLAHGATISWRYLWLLIETFLLGIGFSALLALVIVATRRVRPGLRVPAMAGAALALAALHGWIDALLLIDLRVAGGGKAQPVMDVFVSGLMPFILIYGLHATGLALLLSSFAMRERERQLAEARHAAQQAQLAALRFQLNPHFLFNTLNAISSLIVTRRNDDAERMTMKLSEFLRGSLEADPEGEVPLEEELASIESYLEIEAVRFGARMVVAYQCPARLAGALVPSFLLQPLAENAVKYAVAPSRGRVTMTIGARVEADALLLWVADTGQVPSGPSGSTGLGLSNIARRLAAFHGEAASLDTRRDANGFTATIRLPLRHAPLLRAAE